MGLRRTAICGFPYIKRVVTRFFSGGGIREEEIAMSTEELRKYQRNPIIELSKKLIRFYIVVSFAIVWIGYYNLYAFRTGRWYGGILSIVIYFIIYSYLSKLYKAFKIGTYQIGEIIFSQLLAVGMTDAILYVECCLIARRYVNIVPGIITVFLQLLGVVVWAVCVKQYFIRHIRAGETLIIYGMHDVEEFQKKLEKKYRHLFDIRECIPSNLPIDKLKKKIDKYEIIMLYEIETGVRTETMKYCIENHKKFYMTPRIADIIIQGFENKTFIDTPLLKYEYNYLEPRTYQWKRVLDVAVASAGMLLFAVPMTLAAVAIKLEDGGPVFFKQKRCTENGRVFEILKFRSMVVDAEKNGAVIPCMDGDPRITKVGKIIRRFRVDEMPQIINVLKGDMSIVGPRPERVEHVEEYTKELPEFSYRLRVKGGLTGYAQIYGKYNTSAYDKLKLDLMYIENQSLLMDLKLIMLTLKIIFIPESTEGFEEEKSKKIGEWESKVTWKEAEKRIG